MLVEGEFLGYNSRMANPEFVELFSEPLHHGQWTADEDGGVGKATHGFCNQVGGEKPGVVGNMQNGLDDGVLVQLGPINALCLLFDAVVHSDVKGGIGERAGHTQEWGNAYTPCYPELFFAMGSQVGEFTVGTFDYGGGASFYVG